MPTFKLDGKTIPFEPGDTIIRAAWRQGVEIPHYCWHPGLSAPANCRMCLVDIQPKPGQRPLTLDVLEWDPKAGEYLPRQKPKLQPACYVAAADGMEVLADTSENVRRARHDVQEFLLLNHPVDCPICDQSGECKLQDYWLDYGRYQKRMRDEPVHKPKGVVFGPTIVYDGERCVMCTRCIRFMTGSTMTAALTSAPKTITQTRAPASDRCDSLPIPEPRRSSSSAFPGTPAMMPTLSCGCRPTHLSWMRASSIIWSPA